MVRLAVHRYLILLIFSMVIFSPVISAEEDSINVSQPANFEGEVNVEKLETPEVKYKENKPFLSLRIEITGELMENQFIILEYQEDQVNRTTHAFKGENFELTDIQRTESSYKIPVNKPGEYHLVKLGPRSNWNYYTNNEGECQITLKPQENHEKVEDCNSFSLTIIENLLKITAIILTLLLIYTIYIYAKPRYRERKILKSTNKLASEIKEVNNGDKRNKMLEKLLVAEKKALNENYDEAYNIIKEIEKEL